MNLLEFAIVFVCTRAHAAHVTGTFDDSFLPSSPPPPAPPSAWLHSATDPIDTVDSRLMSLGLPASSNGNDNRDHNQGGRGDENEDGGEDEGVAAVGEDDTSPRKRVDMVKFEVCLLCADPACIS
jgi:hypothetical protein